MKGILYDGVPLLDIDGSPLVYDDTVHAAPPAECCCPTDGCCSGILLEGDTLVAEVIDATNNCVPIGSTVQLLPRGAFLWSSDNCLNNACFNSVYVVCAVNGEGQTVLQLTAVGNKCTSGPACPDAATYSVELIDAQCNPVEFIFRVTLQANAGGFCGCCNSGDGSGTVDIQITKL